MKRRKKIKNVKPLVITTLAMAAGMILYVVVFFKLAAGLEIGPELIVGGIGAAAFFVLQLLFCLKASVIAVKPMPTYVVAAACLVGLFCSLEDGLLGLVLMLTTMYSQLFTGGAVAAAWVIYLIIRLAVMLKSKKTAAEA